ncbi:DUF4214 domain-containing protein [Telluria beijingensis]|uniref:DUF4214 domain-containing protein n=1 Tax=Telluria beijingensis TaxID=3068633 RepID=UPI0027955CAA|nr:DUF4214 domain-containing protein [Massilia sp. REN29]
MKSSTMIASNFRTNLTGAAAAVLMLAATASAQAATAPHSAAPAAVASATASAQEQVRQLYLTLLGREPDAGGLQYWTQAVNRGYSLANVEAQIKSSPEYAKRNPGPVAGPSMVPATPNNFYVSPTGSDTAAGTKAAPFKTLARAAKAVTKAGTTVFVAPGTYAGGFKTTANGTASSRIYWVSTTKWGAKIVPPANSTNNSAWDNRGNYVSIIGFDVDGSKLGSGTKWVHGIYTGGSYNVIEGNRVHHMATTIPCNSAGGSAIGVDSYYKGVKGDVIGNVVHDIGPAGCTYVQGIYHSTSGNIKNNIVYRVGSAAIHLWHDATDVQIVNNTVSSSVFGIIVGGGDFYFTKAGANNVHVHNNIVYDNKYGISEQGTTGKGNTYKNNLVTKNTTYNFQLRNGLTHTGTISSEPLFAGYSRAAATPDYKLTASSPAVGRGLSTYAPKVDIDGKARGSSIDLGAYQR